MEPSNVLDMIRPFDPLSPDAEEEYDAIVRRVNRIRGNIARLHSEHARLEKQFLDNDLIVSSGPRRGEPLSRLGRRRRLARLVETGHSLRQLADEERLATAALDGMNEALDRWARETYGA